jgi:hypothetical protein
MARLWIHGARNPSIFLILPDSFRDDGALVIVATNAVDDVLKPACGCLNG